MTATEFIAACAHLASAGRVFDFDSLPQYDALASAKKAGVGIGVPVQRRRGKSRAVQVAAFFICAAWLRFTAGRVGERATSRRPL